MLNNYAVVMLNNYAVVFMLIALIAALLGFSGMTASLAQILFWFFLTMCILSLVMGWGKRPLW
jgi:uncharacterized membrane protein YtjA (UPF0391 family)